MNIHRATSTAAAALLSLTLLTACGSSGSGRDRSTSTTPSGAAGVDRSNPAALAAMFADAYASGNTPLACSLAIAPALPRLQSEGLCTAKTAWNEQPRQIRECPDVSGRQLYSYQVDHEIDRFLIFTIRLTPSTGGWSVDSVGKSSPGEGLPACAAKNTSSNGGG